MTTTLPLPIALPRLRRDLSVSRQTTAEGAVFVVKDPRRERFYRLPAEAHFIAAQLDGTTPLETVRQRTEEHFQTPVPAAMLQAFVRHLSAAGLLEDPRAEKNRAPRRSRRIAGNLLSLRIRFFDPDRLFNRLVGHIGFFFTPYFLLGSAVLIALATDVAIVNWEDLTQNLFRLYQLASVPLMLAVIFLVIGAHEFAHGLTCKHFGGEVHEVGFLLIYLQPALYCNVSDAWLFHEKSKRLWVGFAGPYFELFLWALATLTWRLTDVETTINFIAFVVMTSSGLKTLLNFNPFIKLDGYYLLSDWLEIPNLRRRAFATVGRGLKRIFGGDVPPHPMPGRERLVCLAYGVVAVASSFVILGYAFAKLGSYLVAQSQPLALAGFVGLLGWKIRRRFNRLFGRANNLSATDDDEVPEPATSDDPAAPPVAPAAPPPKKKKRRHWLRWFWLAVAAAGVAVMIYRQMELRIGGPFEVLPLHNADVRAQIEDIVDQILVHEGDQVRAGDPIARLAGRDVRAQLLDNTGTLAEAQSHYQQLAAGPKPEEIRVAQTAVNRAELALKYARSQLARNQTLAEKKLLSDKELEDSQSLVATAEGDLAEVTSKLNLLRSGNRPEEIASAKAEVERLEAQRHYLEEQIALLTVASPATGIVATPERELEAMRHQLVKKGDLIAKVFELRTITAEIAVSERDIADVRVGLPVVLKVRAFPEKTFFGKVTSIATVAQSTTSSASSASTGLPTSTSTRNASTPKTISVTTEIDNPALLLKPEMTGQAKILCGQRRIVELLTRRLARTVRVEFWSWW